MIMPCEQDGQILPDRYRKLQARADRSNTVKLWAVLRLTALFSHLKWVAIVIAFICRFYCQKPDSCRRSRYSQQRVLGTLFKIGCLVHSRKESKVIEAGN